MTNVSSSHPFRYAPPPDPPPRWWRLRRFLGERVLGAAILGLLITTRDRTVGCHRDARVEIVVVDERRTVLKCTCIAHEDRPTVEPL